MIYTIFVLSATISFVYCFKSQWLLHYGLLLGNDIYTIDEHIWIPNSHSNFCDIVWIDDNDSFIDCYFIFRYIYNIFRDGHFRITKEYLPSNLKIKYINHKGQLLDNPYKSGIPVNLKNKSFIIIERKRKGRSFVNEELCRTHSLPLFTTDS